MTRVGILAALIGFIGVLIVARPDPLNISPGLIAAAASAVAFALTAILTRGLTRTATLPWIIAIGCAGLLAHFCLTTALSLAPASVVMPIDFARLPTIAVIGMLLYNEPLDALVFVGAALIFGANYMNILSQTRKT